MTHREERLAAENERLKDLLSDLLTKVQEMQEEFSSALDDLEDMITDT